MICLVIDFEIEESEQQPFEDMYRDVYVRAVQGQSGFVRSALMRLYPRDVLTTIEAAMPVYNYRMTLEFESEQKRLDWVASPEHDPTWERATGLARAYEHVGYDVIDQAGPGDGGHFEPCQPVEPAPVQDPRARERL